MLNKQSISRVLFHPQAEATIIYLGTAVACRLKRLNPEGSAGRIIPSLFGLAPCGVYQAARLPGRWCALTAPFHPYPVKLTRRFSFLWHFPGGCPRRTLSGTPPCGARTFLLQFIRLPAIAFHARKSDYTDFPIKRQAKEILNKSLPLLSVLFPTVVVNALST